MVMHEFTEGHTAVGDVLLGGARSVKEAMDWATAARAVVVLIRGDDGDDSVFADAAHGVAVMVVDPAMSWSELAAVVYGLVLGVAKPNPAVAQRISSHWPTVWPKPPAVRSSSRTGSRRCWRTPAGNNTPTRRVATIVERQAPERLRDFFDMHGVYAHLAASDEPLFPRPGAGPWSDRPHGGRGAFRT